MDPDDLEERLRRLLKKRAALHKHILARRAEKVDNTVHLQILNARFAKEVRAMLAEGLTMDQVGQGLGMSSDEIFALLECRSKNDPALRGFLFGCAITSGLSLTINCRRW
jgi:hypothetical protein